MFPRASYNAFCVFKLRSLMKLVFLRFCQCRFSTEISRL